MNLSGEIPSSRACSVDVRIHAAARLTLYHHVSNIIVFWLINCSHVLKAFINNGSAISSSASTLISNTRSKLTRKTNHPISLRDRPNTLFRLRRCTLAPSILIALGDFGKFGVQLCRLLVIIRYRLTSICAEGVFVERIELYRVANGMFGTETGLKFSCGWREYRLNVFVWGSPARWWELFCGGTGGH